MVIRRLTEHDVEEFRWLRLRALQEHPEAFGRSFEEGSAEPIERMAARLQSQRDGNFTLGAYESSLVGIVAFVREQGVKTRHKGNIYSVYVAREAQGRGIARALLE